MPDGHVVGASKGCKCERYLNHKWLRRYLNSKGFRINFPKEYIYFVYMHSFIFFNLIFFYCCLTYHSNLFHCLLVILVFLFGLIIFTNSGLYGSSAVS